MQVNEQAARTGVDITVVLHTATVAKVDTKKKDAGRMAARPKGTDVTAVVHAHTTGGVRSAFLEPNGMLLPLFMGPLHDNVREQWTRLQVGSMLLAFHWHDGLKRLDAALQRGCAASALQCMRAEASVPLSVLLVMQAARAQQAGQPASVGGLQPSGQQVQKSLASMHAQLGLHAAVRWASAFTCACQGWCQRCMACGAGRRHNPDICC